MTGLIYSSEPTLIEGGLSIDDRGAMAFVNKFNPGAESIQRFYLVENHQVGMVRAWHAHKSEAKFVLAVSGSALACAVKVNDWSKPNSSATVHRCVLSASKPQVLHIPAGYANGWMSLTPDAKLMFFSTSTLEESKSDDIRFPARYWNPWKVEER